MIEHPTSLANPCQLAAKTRRCNCKHSLYHTLRIATQPGHREQCPNDSVVAPRAQGVWIVLQRHPCKTVKLVAGSRSTVPRKNGRYRNYSLLYHVRKVGARNRPSERRSPATRGAHTRRIQGCCIFYRLAALLRRRGPDELRRPAASN